MNLKNESKLGDIYISFIYRTLSFYRQHLKIPRKLCTPVPLEARSLSHGTLLPLTLKTSLNANLVNIFYSTRETCRLSLTTLMSVIAISKVNYIFLFLKITIFFNCNDIGTLFWMLHSKIERSTGI